jgi:uncharacterized protein (TIGR02145 family)/prepilin-type N-terminal cleavage/methylation domain-containing protein
MFKTKIKGFTLIELLVVIAIIGLLVTLSILALTNARVASRDSKRVSDVKQIQLSLEMYFDSENRYPSTAEFQSGAIASFGSTTGTTTYMGIIPTAPTPNDGACSGSDNTYAYSVSPDGSSYTLDFCLAKKINDLTAGNLIAFPGGIVRGFNVCGDSYSYAGVSYPTVQIGTQCWFAKNLNVGTYIGSGSSPEGADGLAGTNDDCVDVTSGDNFLSCQGASDIQKYCYGDNQGNCTTDGGLYEWAEALGLPADCNNAAAVDSGNGTYSVSCPTSGSKLIAAKQKGICPNGWHIPSDAEQNTLDQFLTDSGQTCSAIRSSSWQCSSAGTKLKIGGTSGFNGVLAGYRLSDGSFLARGSFDYLLSSSPRPGALYAFQAWYRGLSSSDSKVNRNSASNLNRVYGASVRCLKD